jgi:WD40 repeat protein
MSTCRLRELRVALFLAVVSLCAGNSAVAQTPILVPGKNLVGPLLPVGQRWYYVSGSHADVHFYDKNKDLAELTARFAEEIYSELRPLVESRNESRYQIYVFASPTDYLFAQMNQYNYQTVDFNINRLQVYYEGGQLEFYRQLRRQLADALVRELFYGGNLGTNLTSRLLLFVPEWYSNGLMRYLGEGWLPADEAFMRGLNKEGEAFFSEAISTRYHPDQSVLHKSFFYFLEQTYGRKRLGEIVYLTRLTRSVESGFATVLGASSAALTIRWIDWVQTHFPSERVPITVGEQPKLPVGPDERIVAAALSPTKTQYAVLIEQAGVTRLVLVSYPSGRVRHTSVRFGKVTDLHEPRHMHLPLAWNTDGTSLVTAGTRQGKLEIVVVQAADGRKQEIAVGKKLQWISSLSFNPKGDRVVMSGTLDGKTDLFQLDVAQGSLTQLTNTPYDERWPVWSPDGSTIYYVSNGGDSLGTRSRINYAQARSESDVFSLRIPVAGQRPQRLTYTPYASEWNLQVVEGRLLFLTEENGLPNMAALPITGNNSEVAFITNFNTGIEAFTVAKGEMAALSPINSRQRLFQFPRIDLTNSIEVQATPYAEKRRQQYIAKIIAKAKEMEALSERNAARLDSMRADSVKAKPPPKRQARFYVFDERRDTATTGKQSSAASRLLRRLKQRATPPEPFDINKVAVSKLKVPVFGLDLRSLSTEFRLDPYFREGFFVEAELTDQKLYHRVTGGIGGFLDFASTDMYLNYQFMRFRPTLEFGLRKWGRYINDQAVSFGGNSAVQQIIRYAATSAKIGLSYPINRFHRVGAEVEYLNINRREAGLSIDSLDGFDFTGERDLVGLRAYYRFDNTQRIGRYTYRGIRADVKYENYFSRDRGTFDYGQVSIDVKHYLPLFSGIVIASRVAGGFSPGDFRYRQFYMVGGVDNYVAVNFNNRIELPVLVHPVQGEPRAAEPEQFFFTNTMAFPVRGFAVNSRNGSNFGGFSSELRLPLPRLFSSTLPTKNQYGLQIVFFYDAAIAWNAGNPLDIRTPSKITTIPDAFPFDITLRTFRSTYIQGFGTGLRAVLLGFLGRLDLAWGIDDGAIAKPKLQLSIGRDF